MNQPTTRQQRRALQAENKKWPPTLRDVPRSEWPSYLQNTPALYCVMRSRDFLVQIFMADAPASFRLSVCRTRLNGEQWQDGITWDELQRLKREAGFAAFDAIEIYPPDSDIVNVANMRHLWIMRERIGCAWRAGNSHA